MIINRVNSEIIYHARHTHTHTHMQLINTYYTYIFFIIKANGVDTTTKTHIKRILHENRNDDDIVLLNYSGTTDLLHVSLYGSLSGINIFT